MPVHTSYEGELAQQLSDFRTKGQNEAKKHRPPTDALHLDQYETSLQASAETHLASEQRLFDLALSETNRALADARQRKIEFQTKVDQLLSDDSIKGAIESDMAADRQSLVKATEARMRAEVDYRGFRAVNGITEQAVYPESMIWHFATIALLALIETAINAFFFENTQGLLGGFTVALGVAAINMVGAMVLGYGFRYKNLASIDKKIIGWLCLILFVLLSVYCNALFSAFRAEYQVLVDPANVQQLRAAFAKALMEAKQVFFINMNFADFMSFILFGLGTLLSGFAFYKGYTLDDKYPDHGALTRRLRQEQQLEAESQEQLRTKVRNLLERRRADVQSAIHEPGQMVTRISGRLGEIEQAKALLNSQAQAIQRDFSLVLNAYRQANTAVRATDPPAYFRETPDLLSRISVAGADVVTAGLTETRNEVAALQEKYQSALNEKLRLIQAEAAGIQNNALRAFIEEIVQEAQDRINRLIPEIHRAQRGN
jgi:hypothetical protein